MDMCKFVIYSEKVLSFKSSNTISLFLAISFLPTAFPIISIATAFPTKFPFGLEKPQILILIPLVRRAAKKMRAIYQTDGYSSPA